MSWHGRAVRSYETALSRIGNATQVEFVVRT
jgi:hypothetical protein